MTISDVHEVEPRPGGYASFARWCGRASWFFLLPFAALALLALNIGARVEAFVGMLFVFVWVGTLYGPACGAVLSAIAATRNRWYLLATLGWLLVVVFVSREVYLHPPII